jgi:23S rRNA (cytidine1920-2'-O)/16S rRNA (cytidine1409-2'-O)-methyltransferase
LAEHRRERLDARLVREGHFATREAARRAVMAGQVRVAGQVETKAGTPVSPEVDVEIQRAAVEYVSRGGLKLAHALDAWPIAVAGTVALDVGASTGGFTDVLLRRGARKVYAIDVGYGQLAWSLRQDPRVVVRERTNVRHLTPLRLYGHEAPDADADAGAEADAEADAESDAESRGAVPSGDPLRSSRPLLGPEPSLPTETETDADSNTATDQARLAVIDVSFIGLSKVLPAVRDLLLHGARPGEAADVVALVKPQFEAGRESVGKKGVVRDPAVHARVMAEVREAAEALGFSIGGVETSPITGPEGNVEFLLWLRISK